jgi:hypothetical protein
MVKEMTPVLVEVKGQKILALVQTQSLNLARLHFFTVPQDIGRPQMGFFFIYNTGTRPRFILRQVSSS